MSMRSSLQDYEKVQEGLFYAKTLLDQKEDDMTTALSQLKADGVMSGETGEEYIKRLAAVVDTSLSFNNVIRRMSTAADEKCQENGGQVVNAVDNFEEAKRRLTAIADDANAFNGR